MGFKVIILSVTCLSLLTSPTLSAVIYTPNSPCIINQTPCGVQVPTLLGTGLAVKGAAALRAVKDIAALALRAAALKGALIAKGAAAVFGIGAALLGQKPIGVPVTPCNACSNIVVGQPQVPTVLDVISGAAAARERVLLNDPAMYEYITAPRYYSVPIIDEYEVETLE